MLYYRIKMTFPRPPDFSQRGFREVLRGAMYAAADFWHGKIMPRHFQQSAHRRYGYQQRTESYERQKLRGLRTGKAVSAYDLVFSGTTRDSAAKPPLIRAFPTRARLDLLVPPYINMRPNRNGKRAAAPSLGEELTRVTYDEAEQLAAVALDFVEARIGAVRSGISSTTVTVSSAAPDHGPSYLESYTVICE